MDFQDYLFVGVDTHKEEHTASAVNFFHQELKSITIPNNPANFDDFVAELEDSSPNDETLVFGLEDTQGLGRSLAQWLVRKGYLVKEVNPALTKRERKHSPNPDKSDDIDAKAIADALISDWEELPQVEKDETFEAIRALNNQRQNLVQRKTQIKNRLHKLIHQNYPEYKEFFSDPFGKTALAFWEKFPHPAELKNYGETRLNNFLKDQAKSIPNDKAKSILALVDKNKGLKEAAQARNSIITMLIMELKQLRQHLDTINSKLKSAVEKSEYKLTTMPGIDYKLAAMFISNIRSIDRFDSANKLARYAGLAPVEHSSGSHKAHTSRKYGCRDLNHAFYLLALQQIGAYRNGRVKSEIAYSYYQKKLKEGKTRKAALKCLQRRLVDIIYAMMRDRSVYQPPEIPQYEVLQRSG